MLSRLLSRGCFGGVSLHYLRLRNNKGWDIFLLAFLSGPIAEDSGCSCYLCMEFVYVCFKVFSPEMFQTNAMDFTEGSVGQKSAGADFYVSTLGTH